MIKQALSDAEFKIFSEYIEKKSGIYLDESKKGSLEISLILRMQNKGLKEYDKYYKYLLYGSHSTEEFKELLNLVTINETQFYRYPAQFNAFKNEILPSILRNKLLTNNKNLKIWSAGCSSGEEAYTIAMILRETIADLNSVDIEIFATDISKKVLSAAETGIYAPRTLRLLTPQQVSDYFTKLPNNKFKVNNNIGRMVKFSYLNLAEFSTTLFAGGFFDVIFCRNVMIYFKTATIKRMLEYFYKCLSNGGHFFVGHSESLFHYSSDFKPLTFRNAFIYKKDKGAAKKKEKPLPPKKEKPVTSYKPATKVSYKLEQKKKATAKATAGAGQAGQASKKIEVKTYAKHIDSQDEKELYNRAQNYFLHAKLEECQEVVNELRKKNPQSAEACVLQARILSERNNLAKAKEQLDQAKNLDPLLPESYFFSALILSREGKIEAAIAELKKALFLDKDFAPARYQLANLYRIRGQIKEAIREYSNAIDDLGNEKSKKMMPFYYGGFSTDLLLQSAKDYLAALKREVS